MASAPGALILFGGVGLAYWAVFGDKGLLKHSPDRQAILTNLPKPSGTPVVFPTGGGADTSAAHFAEGIAHFETGGGPQSYYRTQNGQAPSAEALLSIQHGAWGKYQFLPGTYRSLSTHYFGRVVTPTPQVQDYIAAHKMQELHDHYHSWMLVAVAWRSGPGWTGRPITQWSAGLVEYVNHVSCYLAETYGEGWGLIPLIGHPNRKGEIYRDTSKPYGNLGNCGGQTTTYHA
jgi:hypothetical protein